MLVNPISQKLKRTILFFSPIIVSVLLTPLSSCAEEIVLGMSAAFKGTSQALGTELYRGSMAYFEHINSQGGIDGDKIIIKAYDDSYNPTKTIKNTITLVNKDQVTALFNYVGTPTVTRILPLVSRHQKENMLLFFPFTGAQPQRQQPYKKFVFNLRASYQQETEGLVDNFIKIGRKKIAIFYQADAYGRSGWYGVKQGLAKYKLKIVEEATYRRGTPYAKSMKKQVKILQETQPDAIISIGSYAASAAFIRDARDAGLDVPIANISFVGSESLLNQLRETGEEKGKDYTKDLINSQVVPSYHDTSLPAVQEYRTLMKQYRYKTEPPAHLRSDDYQPLPYSFVSFEGFLNAKLLVEIIRKMDRADPRGQREQLRKATESIQDLKLGIEAPVSFTTSKHQGLDQVYYTTIENNRYIALKNWQRWAQ